MKVCVYTCMCAHVLVREQLEGTLCVCLCRPMSSPPHHHTCASPGTRLGSTCLCLLGCTPSPLFSLSHFLRQFAPLPGGTWMMYLFLHRSPGVFSFHSSSLLPSVVSAPCNKAAKLAPMSPCPCVPLMQSVTLALQGHSSGFTRRSDKFRVALRASGC